MLVKLKYRTKDNQLFGTKKEITVKEAKEYYKKELKNNIDVIEVYLTHFDGWRWYKYKILKG